MKNTAHQYGAYDYGPHAFQKEGAVPAPQAEAYGEQLREVGQEQRRDVIGVAAAVQLAIFPVWLGAALVLGLPDHAILYSRLLSFGINLVTIAAAGVEAYAILHLGAGRGWGSPRSGSCTG